MQFDELERQILQHRRARRREALILAGVAALGLAVLAAVAVVVLRVF